MLTPSTTRNRIALWAAVLALCLRLLLPGLHVHAPASTAAGAEIEIHGLAPASGGGCACSEFRWPDAVVTGERSIGERSTGEQSDEQADDDAAAAATDHACFACDFELANPAAPPAAATSLAHTPLSAAATPVLAHQRGALRCPSPPGRAPPTTA